MYEKVLVLQELSKSRSILVKKFGFKQNGVTSMKIIGFYWLQ